MGRPSKRLATTQTVAGEGAVRPNLRPTRITQRISPSTEFRQKLDRNVQVNQTSRERHWKPSFSVLRRPSPERRSMKESNRCPSVSFFTDPALFFTFGLALALPTAAPSAPGAGQNCAERRTSGLGGLFLAKPRIKPRIRRDEALRP